MLDKVHLRLRTAMLAEGLTKNGILSPKHADQLLFGERAVMPGSVVPRVVAISPDLSVRESQPPFTSFA